MRINPVSNNLNTNYDTKINKENKPKTVSFGINQEAASSLPDLETAQKIVSDYFRVQLEPLESEIEDFWKQITNGIKKIITPDETLKLEMYYKEAGYFYKDEKRPPITKILDQMYKKMFKYFACMTVEEDRNCMAIETKNNKKLAEDIFKLSEFDSKIFNLYYIYKIGDSTIEKTPFRFDYIRINDTFNNNDELQDHIAQTLKAREEHYKKTGRKNVMFFENMEKLGRQDLNSKPNIAMMKDLLQKSDEAYHTQIHFTYSDFKKLDPGFRTVNRICARWNIDELGVTEEQFQEYKKHEECLRPLLDKVQKIYNDCWKVIWPYRKQWLDLTDQMYSALSSLEYIYKNPNEYSEQEIRKILEKYKNIPKTPQVTEFPQKTEHPKTPSIPQKPEIPKTSEFSKIKLKASYSPSNPVKFGAGMIAIGAIAYGLYKVREHQAKTEISKQSMVQETKNKTSMKQNKIPSVFSAFG